MFDYVGLPAYMTARVIECARFIGKHVMLITMSETGLAQAREKMAKAGVTSEAIEVFTAQYHRLEAGATGIIPEDSITAIEQMEHIRDANITPEVAREAISKTVVIKLNGGLGTSMGMEKAKSLLPVRGDKRFIDLIVEQVRQVRRAYNVSLPLLFMDSFRTQDDTLEALAAYPDLPVEGLPLDFVQNQEPKITADTLEPVSWPADPSLEWCPPGHGDIYTALWSTGILKTLIERGYRYACTSNADNLGAFPWPEMAGWFAQSGAPYAAEMCRRTAADRKGGHLAVRKSDGRIILRDTAQTAPEEMDYFTDEHRHPFFHTNNLWFDLHALYAQLEAHDGVLSLPLIRNKKTVDPRDSSSPEVYQLESAMGAAIEIFEGARPICVERERFLPVKTTNDLLTVASDAYELTEEYRLRLLTETAPLVDLDPKYFKKINDFTARFPTGAPSLKEATSFTVRGDWTIDSSLKVIGDTECVTDEPDTLP